MIHIRTERDFSEPGLIEAAARAALEHEAASPAADVTVVLAGDDELRELNQKYLGINEPTDVLAFPSKEQDPDSGGPYVGDVIISLPRAEEQAKAAGHALRVEVQLLVVHGVLHLLGYDHAEPEQKAKMWKVQAAILQQLGLGKIEIRD
jgi:probable rRNA maturation factor